MALTGGAKALAYTSVATENAIAAYRPTNLMADLYICIHISISDNLSELYVATVPTKGCSEPAAARMP